MQTRLSFCPQFPPSRNGDQIDSDSSRREPNEQLNMCVHNAHFRSRHLKYFRERKIFIGLFFLYGEGSTSKVGRRGGGGKRKKGGGGREIPSGNKLHRLPNGQFCLGSDRHYLIMSRTWGIRLLLTRIFLSSSPPPRAPHPLLGNKHM